MPRPIDPPPASQMADVTEVLHGIPITDPYRWLEEPHSPATRDWIRRQSRYARSYFDSIPGRQRIQAEIGELLDRETTDSLQKSGNRYFYRKRFRGEQQPCICFRERLDGPDHVLVDPKAFGMGANIAVRPLGISPSGRLLLYERKEGGERTGLFCLFDLDTRVTVADILPRGSLRGFAFTEDSSGFYYVHQAGSEESRKQTAFHHILGTGFADDREIFSVGPEEHVRLHLVPGIRQLGFLVYRGLDPMRTSFFVWEPGSAQDPRAVIEEAEYRFGPYLLGHGRIVALTDQNAPNFKIVEIHNALGGKPEVRDLVAMREQRIQGCVVTPDNIFVAYLADAGTKVDIFDSRGIFTGQVPSPAGETIRLCGCSPDGREIFLEGESFTRPVYLSIYRREEQACIHFSQPELPMIPADISQEKVTFAAGDGASIPMFLVGRRNVLAGGPHPTVMTSYGGFGVATTARFSVLAMALMERGCLLALPNIRGGSEFGEAWHAAAKGRNRKVAFDDFLRAAEWLVETRRAEPERLAIFGASHGGLLVGVALTERPNLFCAAISMVPVLDMLRYHLFDGAIRWKEEFGTAEDPDDFLALYRYSPYHRVSHGVAYPATMFVSGDLDQVCNPLHARKMTARLQAASVSHRPILLDDSDTRGHSPVLPLQVRREALTDRIAFLCHQLGLTV
jgi:prolyl oligopeptidase